MNDFDEPIISWDNEMRDENAHKKKMRHNPLKDDATIESKEEDEAMIPDYVGELEGIRWKRIILYR